MNVLKRLPKVDIYLKYPKLSVVFLKNKARRMSLTTSARMPISRLAKKNLSTLSTLHKLLIHHKNGYRKSFFVDISFGSVSKTTTTCTGNALPSGRSSSSYKHSGGRKKLIMFFDILSSMHQIAPFTMAAGWLHICAEIGSKVQLPAILKY